MPLMLDMATHRPSTAPRRSADQFAQWLRHHPGVRIICRDRARAYANPRELHQAGD